MPPVGAVTVRRPEPGERAGRPACRPRADTAVVSLGFLADDVTLDIYDDGAGFDSSAAGLRADGTGFGLVSLRDRVAALGGSLAVESAPGEGTVVAIRLPLAGAAGPEPVAGNGGGRRARASGSCWWMTIRWCAPGCAPCSPASRG